MIIIDLWNQIARLHAIQVTVIYSLVILVTVTSECRVKRDNLLNSYLYIGKQCKLRSCVTERGVWSGSACNVCSNLRKFGVKKNTALHNFSQPTLRDLPVFSVLWFICLLPHGMFRDAIDLFNVFVFIVGTNHVITMLCHVTKNCGWQTHFWFYWYQLIQA